MTRSKVSNEQVNVLNISSEPINNISSHNLPSRRYPPSLPPLSELMPNIPPHDNNAMCSSNAVSRSSSSTTRLVEGRLSSLIDRNVCLPTPQSPEKLHHPHPPVSPFHRVARLPTPVSQNHDQCWTLSDPEQQQSLDVSELILTPDSSPFGNKATSPGTSRTQQEISTFKGVSSDLASYQKATSQIKRDSSQVRLPPKSHLSSPLSTLSDLPRHSSLLPTTEKQKSPLGFNSTSSHPKVIDDVFSTNLLSLSTPPPSPTRPATTSSSSALDCVRRDNFFLPRQKEEPRHEYQKRLKRSFAKIDDEEQEGAAVITLSPHQVQTLRLFQETSEESFEESLMVGGYDRYRSVDWLEQSHLGHSSHPNSVSVSEIELPLAPQEIKRQKRLTAFQKSSELPPSQLRPVEVEGMGRILIDLSVEESPQPQEAPPPKKKARRKRNSKTPSVERELEPPSQETVEPEQPNWPDSEFPWQLRNEEWVNKLKSNNTRRLGLIKRFLDEESDDENDWDNPSFVRPIEPDQLRVQNPTPTSLRMGRGELVPLPADLNFSPTPRSKVYFPTDPSDARAALLSLKSVRALSLQLQVQDGDAERGKAITCACGEVGDGPEVLRCEACWSVYHLSCVQARETGARERQDEFESVVVIPPDEPTFVPTDVELKPNATHDVPFFQISTQDSPPWGAAAGPETSLGPHAHAQYTSIPSSTPSRGMMFPSGATHTTPTPKIAMWWTREGMFQTPLYGQSLGTGMTPRTPPPVGGVDEGTRGFPSLPRNDESPVSRGRALAKTSSGSSVSSLRPFLSTEPRPDHQ